MTALLDTHTFIWMDSDPKRVTLTVLKYLGDPAFAVFLSVVSLLEMEIKVSSRKLTLRKPVREIVAEHLATTPLRLLEINADHAYGLSGLPHAHKDPFDRMLAAQALVEGAVLLTSDPIFKLYPIQTDW
jgi:PIN domain nuclease of toxin-antitoxin system